nr:unnamed protein product [Callosobruchus analis]
MRTHSQMHSLLKGTGFGGKIDKVAVVVSDFI